MVKQACKVRFIKGTDEIEINPGMTQMGMNEHSESYVYRANDGNAYLMAAAKYFGRVQRFWFRKGDVTGDFPSEKARQEYLDHINKAAGEAVAVAAEAA